MCARDSSYDCSYRHDIRQLVLRTLLTYLELDGFIREGTPFYSEYRFKALAPVGDIPNFFEGERRDFVRKILDGSKKGKTWYSIDLDSTAVTTGSPRDRVVRALDYLAEQGMLELEAAGVRNRFAVLERPKHLEALAVDLHTRTERREERELSRIGQILALFQHEGCLAEGLGAHFGEHLPEPCGHCSWCRGKKALELPPRAKPLVDEGRWKEVEAVRAEKSEFFADPRALARFLCGLSTPKSSRAKLGSHPLFGVFSEVPFAAVLERIEGERP